MRHAANSVLQTGSLIPAISWSVSMLIQQLYILYTNGKSLICIEEKIITMRKQMSQEYGRRGLYSILFHALAASEA